MRLIVHMGLHKTASTYLQHLLNDNHDALLARGVYYQKQAGYPAHHFEAWDILRGNGSAIGTMVAAARSNGCHTVILSSEDLEGAIFQREAAALIEAAASTADVQDLEWHMCIRDAGEYFSSLYAQLQHHVYADALGLFYEVLRDGMIFIPDPLAGRAGTPFWCFCFDHYRYIASFAAQTRHPVVVHDYKDSAPFPGWRILAQLNAIDAITRFPGVEGRNQRLDDAAVNGGYCAEILRVIGSDVHRERLQPLIEAKIRSNTDSVRHFADAVGEHFAASTAATLKRFGSADQVNALAFAAGQVQ